MITELTPDVTWIHECYPIDDGRHVHSSVYTIEHDGQHILVDTGDLPNQETMLSQIETATGGGVDAMFISKSHMPHSANVIEFAERWPDVELVFPGGIPNVHGFPEITQWPHHSTETLLGRTFSTTRGPLLDLPHTTWLYDHASGVFFTVDGFCYYHQAGDCAGLAGDVPVRFRDVRDVTAAILYWLRYVDPDRVIDALDETLAAFDADWIAPCHGNPIPRDEIPAVTETVGEAIRDIAASYEPRSARSPAARD